MKRELKDCCAVCSAGWACSNLMKRELKVSQPERAPAVASAGNLMKRELKARPGRVPADEQEHESHEERIESNGLSELEVYVANYESHEERIESGSTR